MRNNFDLDAALLIPICPYAKHRASNNTKKIYPKIFDVTLKGNIQSRTDVYLCCNTNKEYVKLSK